MSVIKTRFGERDFAREIGFEPVSGNTATNVQVAIENNLAATAPTDAQYYVAAANSSLSNEVVVPAFIQTLLDDTDAATARTTLGLVIGTNVQAYDADLDTWAGLTPSANAQSLVTAADYAAMRALLDLEPGTDFYSISAADAAFQPLDADLTIWAGLTPSANAQSLVTAADYAAMRALLDLEPGTDFYSISAADAAFQPLDANLTSWASVTRASGFDTFAATPSSANLRSLLSDEVGTGAAYFVGGALGTPASGNLSNCSSYPSAAEGTNGILDKATDSEIRAATSGAHAICAEDLSSANALVTLTDAATIAVDWTSGINFTVTITTDRILGNPTNEIPGTFRTVYVIASGGTRTLTFGSEYGGTPPTLTDITTTQGYLLSIYCRAAGQFLVSSMDASPA